MRGHIERLMGLNEIDVVRIATTTNDNNLTLAAYFHRMIGEILNTTGATGCSPVAAVNPDRPAALVNYTTDAKAWSDHGGNSFALFMDGVAIQKPGADTCPTSASFKVKREHMCRHNRARGSKARTNGFPASGKTGEVMKSYTARYDDMRKVLQRTIDFHCCATFYRSQRNHRR